MQLNCKTVLKRSLFEGKLAILNNIHNTGTEIQFASIYRVCSLHALISSVMTLNVINSMLLLCLALITLTHSNSSAVQCSAVQCSTVQCGVVQCSAVWYSVMQSSAVQCSAVQCSTVQCSAVQCSDHHHPTLTAM